MCTQSFGQGGLPILFNGRQPTDFRHCWSQHWRDWCVFWKTGLNPGQRVTFHTHVSPLNETWKGMLEKPFSLCFSALSEGILLSAPPDELLMSLYKCNCNETDEMFHLLWPALPERSSLDVCIIVVICHHQHPLLHWNYKGKKQITTGLVMESLQGSMQKQT